MTLPRIVHLVDDTTAGGVMRVLDHILTAPKMARTAHHSLISIDRGRMPSGRIKADVIVSHLSISWRTLPMLATLRALYARTPLVHVEHSYTRAFVCANVTHKRRFAVLLRSAYGLFDRVVAVSEAQGQWLAQSGAVRACALSVIASCVDLSPFRAAGRAKSPARVIGAIGRLDRQKGFDTLICAFRRTTCPDVSLHIYGEGSEEETLRNLAGDDPRIRFMGFSSDPVAVMAAVDVVAMPSNWEAYGLVAIEALAANRYLLVNAIDGLVDHVAHGARAVDENSVEAWHDALDNALRDDVILPELRGMTARYLETAFATKWRHMLSNILAQRTVQVADIDLENELN